ncbi:hypothetical protein MCG98_18675 [Ruminococcus sp. OA3]|uniref:hypothetical protein n=1 Tax=Ruminococcus sp. OA3 TaxID=2914164 RepID=UPI001F06043B|nr:hypothetical protein [Ruminococcus sp. OA3]MCH1980966.1 hypothetical protein [Ruminococcus sp. OA3]MCH1984583.1 hypothetical protein [Ruminococcus sp. OA3]
MKKKIICLMLCCIFVTSIYGCNSNASPESSDVSKQLETLQKENEELKKKLETSTPTPEQTKESITESVDFEKGTQRVTHGSFSVEVPTNWELRNVENSDNLYFYASSDNSTFLMLTNGYIEGFNNAHDEYIDMNMDGWVEGIGKSQGVISVSGVQNIEYNKIHTKFLSYKQKVDGISYTVQVVGFPTDYGIASIGMCVIDENTINYDKDFKSILNTLELIPISTPEPTVTPTQPPEPTIESYGAGTLKVGVDIPAGEYMVLATNESRGGYFSVNSDANGDDILFNDNFDYNSIITIQDGEYLELSHAKAYKFDEWCLQNTFDTAKEGCMMKVGVNIPAGEYMVTSEDEGYYCIYPDSRQSDIISNDNFEGQSYISVSDGQYLILSHCSIAQ